MIQVFTRNSHHLDVRLKLSRNHNVKWRAHESKGGDLDCWRTPVGRRSHSSNSVPCSAVGFQPLIINHTVHGTFDLLFHCFAGWFWLQLGSFASRSLWKPASCASGLLEFRDLMQHMYHSIFGRTIARAVAIYGGADALPQLKAGCLNWSYFPRKSATSADHDVDIGTESSGQR